MFKQDCSVKCLKQLPLGLVLVLHNLTSLPWRSNRKWFSVLSSSRLSRAENLGCTEYVTDMTSAIVYLHTSVHAHIETHTCSQSSTHKTVSDGPVYHPVILLHYGLASGCCLATVISPVVVTAVVAICSAVAQLLCPGLIAHCFAVPPHTAVRIQVPFILCKWQSPFVGRDLVLTLHYDVHVILDPLNNCWELDFLHSDSFIPSFVLTKFFNSFSFKVILKRCIEVMQNVKT